MTAYIGLDYRPKVLTHSSTGEFIVPDGFDIWNHDSGEDTI